MILIMIPICFMFDSQLSSSSLLPTKDGGPACRLIILRQDVGIGENAVTIAPAVLPKLEPADLA